MKIVSITGPRTPRVTFSYNERIRIVSITGPRKSNKIWKYSDNHRSKESEIFSKKMVTISEPRNNNEGMKIFNIISLSNIIWSKTLNVDYDNHRTKEYILNIKLNYEE